MIRKQRFTTVVKGSTLPQVRKAKVKQGSLANIKIDVLAYNGNILRTLTIGSGITVVNSMEVSINFDFMQSYKIGSYNMNLWLGNQKVDGEYFIKLR